MTYPLRILLLAFTILSLLAARWAYVRGQPQQARLVPLPSAPSLAFSASPQWLPGASWCNWSAPAVSQRRASIITGPEAAAL